MSKMPIDREENQKDIFRRFGIPKLRNEEVTKPEQGKDKETQPEDKRKHK